MTQSNHEATARELLPCISEGSGICYQSGKWINHPQHLDACAARFRPAVVSALQAAEAKGAAEGKACNIYPQTYRESIEEVVRLKAERDAALAQVERAKAIIEQDALTIAAMEQKSKIARITG